MRDAVVVPEEQNDPVTAYWHHHTCAAGDRGQRLAADGSLWASARVDDVMRTNAVDEALDLLESLLAAPPADAAHIGAGPLEELLIARPEVDAAVARRCRTSAAASTWREAVAAVWLSQHDHARLPPLADHLGPPLQGS